MDDLTHTRSLVTTKMRLNGHEEIIRLAIADLGDTDIYLGHDWLKKHNLLINWWTGFIGFVDEDPNSGLDDNPIKWEEDKSILLGDATEVIHLCQVQANASTQLAIQAQDKSKPKTPSLLFYLWAFEKVFEPEEFDKLSPRRMQLSSGPYSLCLSKTQ
jgi:hypothetical protein